MNVARGLCNAYKSRELIKLLARECTSQKQVLQKMEIKSIEPIQHMSQELDTDFEDEIKELRLAEKESILAPLNEDISYVGPYVRPTFNFAAYVNKSETLKQLVDLGVNLHKVEKKKAAPEFIMKLDFEKDIKPHLFFLHDLGVSSELLGDFITNNPYIFQVDLETLAVRVNYLQSKKFSESSITRIVTKNPYWLMFSTTRIDVRLGHFQSTFALTGDEIRLLATKQPKLITYNMEHLKLNTFSIKEEMGFDDEQIKSLLLSIPKFWMMSQESILSRFEYLHNTMKISHEQMLKMPKILFARKIRLEQRHLFLVKLGRAQYDPKKENYVSLDNLDSGSDSDFCANVAKSSVQAYNTFLKSL